MLELRAGLCPGLFEDDLAAGPSRAHRFLPLGRSHGGMSCLGHAKTKIVIAIVNVAANSTKMTSSIVVVFANGVSGFTVHDDSFQDEEPACREQDGPGTNEPNPTVVTARPPVLAHCGGRYLVVAFP